MKLTIDIGERHQTIEGFGASGAWSMDPIGAEWSDDNKNNIADLLFSIDRGIGLSSWRFNIGAGSSTNESIGDPWRRSECFMPEESGPYDWSAHKGQRWFLRAAKDRGVERFIAFVNSPPVWATKNGLAFCSQGSGSTNLKDGYETAYARFLTDVLMHFRDEEGIDFKSISPVNEPIWEWEGGQEGCRYNNEDLVRVVKALYTRLSSSGVSTEIDLVDAGELGSLLDDEIYAQLDPSKPFCQNGNNSAGLGKYREYIKDLLGNPEIRTMIGNHLSAHSYWTDISPDHLTVLRMAVRNNMNHWSAGSRLSVSEYCVMEGGRDLGISPALRMAKVIHHDLVAAEASEWQWWLALSPYDYKDGLLYTDYRRTGEQNILTSKLLWALGNYSRFIRPGSIRIKAALADAADGIYASAFLSHDSERLIAVIVNASDTETTVKLDAGGTAVSGVTPYITDYNLDLSKSVGNAGNESVSIPKRSIVTIIAQIGNK